VPKGKIFRPDLAWWRKPNQTPEERREYKLTNQRKWQLMRDYGLTTEEVNQRLQDQDLKCAICLTGDPGKGGFQVDHDHDTGKFRGMLCSGCNRGIGFLRESADLLMRAAKYLITSKLLW